VGVVLYDPAGGDGFIVAYGTGPEAPVGQALTDSGGEGAFEFSVPVNASGIVDIHFDLAVAAAGVRATADQVSVRVTGPGGLTHEAPAIQIAPGASGAASSRVSLHVRDVPPERSLSAIDEDTARRLATEDLDWTAGSGTWTVVVTIDGGQGGPGPAAPTYSLTLETAVQTAVVRTVSPASPPVRG